MTTDILATEIKVLVLRIIAQQREDELGKFLNDAADEIEALVARAALNGGMALEFKVRAEAAEAERDRLKTALVRLRDCDWVITLPDRMDAVREIARKALENNK